MRGEEARQLEKMEVSKGRSSAYRAGLVY